MAAHGVDLWHSLFMCVAGKEQFMPRKAKKTTRRGNKEGSIYKRKDGKWCGQVLVGYSELGKAENNHSKPCAWHKNA